MTLSRSSGSSSRQREASAGGFGAASRLPFAKPAKYALRAASDFRGFRGFLFAGGDVGGELVAGGGVPKSPS